MSKWEKLLRRIHTLSANLRFAELQKILESYGYVMKSPPAEAVIARLESRDANQLQFQNMTPLREFILKKCVKS